MSCKWLLLWYTVSLAAVSARASGRPSHPFGAFFVPYYRFVDGVYANLRGNGPANVTESCSRDTESLLSLAERGDVHALKFLDATGKAGSGILEGGIHFFGSYSECLRSNIHDDSGNLKISGKHCSVELTFVNTSTKIPDIPKGSWIVLVENSQKPTIGLCIPSSCETSDVNSAVYQSGTELLHVNSTSVFSCSENLDFSHDTAAIGVLVLFAFFISLTLVATGYDIWSPRFKQNITISCEAICDTKDGNDAMSYSFPEKCLLSFSLVKNIPLLLGVEDGNSSKKRTIGALHGLRFLTMATIILLHTYSFAMKFLSFRNSQVLQDVPKQFAVQLFANASFVVDTFYVMSGLLVTYVTLRMVERENMKFNCTYFVLHRIIRLSPLLIMVSVFCATILNYIGSGPKWHFCTAMYTDWCKENWWLNALYLQNFINTENMCLGHTWYLATDFQIYIAVIPILILFYKKVWCAYVFTGLYFSISVAVTFTLTYVNNFPAVPYMSDDIPLEVVNQYYKHVYIKPYCRVGPYLVGMLVGYLYYKKHQVHLKKVHVAVAWTASVLLALFILFIMFGANSGNIPARGFAATYSAFARTVWAACMSWLIIACAYGYGGFVNSFLSWKALIPLSRLTYSAYLIHPVVVEVYYGNVEMALDFSYGNMLYIILGNLVCTYCISFVLTLLFELPFGALESAIKNRKSRSIYHS